MLSLVVEMAEFFMANYDNISRSMATLRRNLWFIGRNGEI